MTMTVEQVFVKKLDLVQRFCTRAFIALSAQDREEATAEVVAQTWAFCVDAAKRGRVGEGLTMFFAERAILRVKSGRKLASTGVRNDVTNRRTQDRYGYGLIHLGALFGAQPRGKGNTRNTADVIFDLADWMDTLPLEQQHAVCCLAEGLNERETSERVGVSKTMLNTWRNKWRLSCSLIQAN